MVATRREQLLEATVDYLLENGANGLSLRPLAAAIGTKARLLIYHFGSRDVLISSALSILLLRVQQAFLAMHSEATLDRTLLGFWNWATDTPNERYLRLFFEVHGLAIREQERYGQYLRGAIESWKVLIASRLDKQTMNARRREEMATLIIATVDGLLLDYLATGDRERTTRALTLFTKRLKKEGTTS
jgi:AcrR family transcriptional regulator